MQIFGLDEEVVGGLIRAVSEHELTAAEVTARFAVASWSAIAEPGDRIAGQIVSALGAAHALAILLERAETHRVVSAVSAAGTELAADDVDKALARWRPRLESAPVVDALRQAERLSISLVIPADPLWPEGFADLEYHAPHALWVRGNTSALATFGRSIALVGARAATGYGEHVTMEASAGLVDRGYTIVSGAAYGIDGMAHRAALASSGCTVAFLAGGVDRFYPSGHDALLTRIVEQGAVVSELPCGAQPSKWRFLQRNRLISASSLATVVLEAGWRSGSLNTAGHAATLGRPLGAVPGPVTSAASAGCHRLIREYDAVCVTNAQEMAELAPIDLVTEAVSARLDGPTESEVRVVDALSRRSPREPSDVAQRSGLSVATVQSVLGSLGLEGRVVHNDRGWLITTPR